MAAITDYATLQTAIQDWLRNRSDVTASLCQGFIQLAEAQMNRRLQTRLSIARSTITITAETLAVPADFSGAISMMLQSNPISELNFVTPDGLNLRANGAGATQTGNPDSYTVEGSSFRFYPYPGTSVTAKLTYRQRIPALSGTNTTNWVLTNHPDAYLFGSLLQSAPWLGRDERVPLWQAAFGQVLSDIMENDKTESFATNLTPQPGSTVI